MKAWLGFQKGVDLGGWFSQCVHTAEHYDSFIKEEDFGVIASWGADHVRLPVDYDLLEGADGAPKEEGFLRLSRAANAAKANGLNMIIDLHKAAGFSFDPDEGETGFFENAALQERFCALWERLAERFGGEKHLAFELLNEVTEKRYGPVWNHIASECIRRIRAFAPETPILVGGYYHNSAVAVRDIDVPLDGNIVYNFHCYEPLIFTHQGAGWIPTMDPAFRISVRSPYCEMDAAARVMAAESCAGLDKLPPNGRLDAGFFMDFMREAAETADKAGVPLYCGEYGVIDRASPEDALEWYKLINAAFRFYGIGRAAWSYRLMDFGLADERMDGVRKELVKYL